MITLLQNKIKNNFYLLGTTAFPGIHKIVTLFFVNVFFSIQVTADYINDIFILYLFGYLTVFNWANFVLSDMLKLPETKQFIFFGRLSSLVFVVNIALLLVVFLLFYFGWLTDFAGFSTLLLSWSYHQLWRHYLVSKSILKRLFFSDLVILVLSTIAIYISFLVRWNIYFLLSIPLVVTPLIVHFIPFAWPKKKWKWKIYKRLSNYTLINLSTGGIQLIFAPLSHQLLGPEFTRAIGFTNNLASVVLLIPRAMAYHFMPKMALEYRSALNGAIGHYVLFEKTLMRLLLFFLIAGSLLLLMFFLQMNGMNLLIVFMAFLVYANLLSSQLSLPISNLLVISSRSSILLKYNLVYFFMVLVGALVLFLSPLSSVSMMIVFSLLTVFLNVLRFVFLKNSYPW